MIKKTIIFILIILTIFSFRSTYAYWAKGIQASTTTDAQMISIGTWLVSNSITYDFETVDSLNTVLSDGGSVARGSFRNRSTSIQSNNGLLYIPNANDTYSITVKAQMLNSYGSGYGVLFDTIATDLSSQTDTGYIVQFDRGFADGEIIIRPRVNGGEQNPVYRYAVGFDSSGNFVTSGGTKDKYNDWWFDTHELTLVVSNVASANAIKEVSVFIDQQYLFSYQYASTYLVGSQVEDYLVGLRNWSGTVAYYQINIT